MPSVEPYRAAGARAGNLNTRSGDIPAVNNATPVCNMSARNTPPCVRLVCRENIPARKRLRASVSTCRESRRIARHRPCL
eukprot:6933666-Pyramimonas_sp.AAC.1